MNHEVTTAPTGTITNPADNNRSFADLLKSEPYQKQLTAALPRGLTAERMVRVLLTAINKTPKLLECSKESLWMSVLDCAALGLFPDALGRAYLVPYKNKCTLVIGYKGLIDLAYRSDRVMMIQTGIVFEDDFFEYEKGLDPRLRHIPATTPKSDAKILFGYSVAHLQGEGSSFEVMTLAEMERIRESSPSKDSGPWKTDRLEMYRKTVFRKHSKYLPMSSELAHAMAVDGDQPDYGNLHAVGDGSRQQAARFAKDQAKQVQATVTTADEPAITEATTIALAKQLPDTVVAQIFEDRQIHSLAGIAPDKLADIHADLTKALQGVRP